MRGRSEKLTEGSNFSNARKICSYIYLTENGVVETYGAVKIYHSVFLTSPMEGGKQTSSHFGHFYTDGIVLGAVWLRGWVRMRVGLDVVRTIISAPDSNEIPQFPVVHPNA